MIIPNWPAPKRIKAVTTTRSDGNLALHVGDDAAQVQQNRLRLTENLQLPSPPVWLNQVHGSGVISLPLHYNAPPTADAAYCRQPNRVCAVLTADCLPVLITDKNGQEIAAVHAGWRGLAAGVLDQALTFFQADPRDLLIWLGPAIGPKAFEVGNEVRQAFLDRQLDYETAFVAHNGRWLANLYQLATINLNQLGVSHIYGGKFCTYQDKIHFYSYRREKGHTGRMATLVWIETET
ncbi:peptidoglycan editing factor PgeF [Coxiella burnetii]|uniref:peptidoglycan editing factor PgeF n=1 Tax=Coxiella burnetii TaxID=777 RepID=UPI0015E16BD8|nr:peptidoglycan editing factor PgeF [Coxiella burnetii]